MCTYDAKHTDHQILFNLAKRAILPNLMLAKLIISYYAISYSSVYVAINPWQLGYNYHNCSTL